MRPYTVGLLLAFTSLQPPQLCFSQQSRTWTDSFLEDNSSFSSQGTNPYFVLEPGYQLRFEGKEGSKELTLVITVLNQTQMVDGIETRIVEERETSDGKLLEISRNFFAISKRTNAVYYFGEDVDMYKNDKITGHEGSWKSGTNGARYGMLIPGMPLLGSRYYQEIAPDVAMDRCEIISLSERVQTQAGTFENCLKTEETTPLEPKAKEYKYYANGIGLVQDGELLLVSHGFAKK